MKTIIIQFDDFTPTFPREELEKAFNHVADPNDWKAPIQGYVREDEREITFQAVRYFTATNPSFKSVGKNWLLVEAQGYRNGPAGDH